MGGDTGGSLMLKLDNGGDATSICRTPVTTGDPKETREGESARVTADGEAGLGDKRPNRWGLRQD